MKFYCNVRYLSYILMAFFFFLSYSDLLYAQVGRPKAYKQGMVVSATKQASEAGLEILKKGGNAIDAAVATHFALAVTFPAAGNLGGGGFLVLRLANGEVKTLDFREKAPKKAFRDMYLDSDGKVTDKSLIGHLAVGVPGSVEGMLEALEKYGTLPIDVVLEPAIRLANKGFNLSYEEATSLNANRNKFNRFKSSKAYFTKSDSSDFQEGEIFIQSDLGKTLERIAIDGKNGFYSGITAELIVKEMQQYGGLLDLSDLQTYKSVWRNPIRITYKEYELITVSPPSAGGILLKQILGMIEPYSIGIYGWNSAESIHLLAEAMKRAYADRATYIGDPDFVTVPTDELTKNEYIRARMSDFSWSIATPSDEIFPGDVPSFSESEETTHFSVVDKFGNAVSVTTTLNGGYGSHVAVGGAGFLLNNEMDDFSAKPGVPNLYGLTGGAANAIEPGKRMVSSMTPTIVTKNGNLSMVLGTPGGSTIITTVLQVFLNMAEFGMDVQQAVSAPRIHHQWLPDVLYHEPYAFSRSDQTSLEARGYQLKNRKGYSGRADCIQIDENDNRLGGADPRGSDFVAGH